MDDSSPTVPTIPANHVTDYEPEPVQVLRLDRSHTVVVPGKPNNRRNRRANTAANKKAEARFNKQAAALVRRTAQTPLQTEPEQEKEPDPVTSESP